MKRYRSRRAIKDLASYKNEERNFALIQVDLDKIRGGDHADLRPKVGERSGAGIKKPYRGAGWQDR